jgi:hypothetical protein
MSQNNSIFKGSVGINTINPISELDVNGIITGGNLNIDYHFSQSDTLLSNLANTGKCMIAWNRSGGWGETDLISNRGAGSQGGFNFYDYTNDGTLNHLVRFDGEGYIGIMTQNPTAPLSINGNSYIINGSLGFNRNPTGGILPPGGQSGSARFQLTPGTDTFTIESFNSSGNSTGGLTVVGSTGMIGIGTLGPYSTLNIAGNGTNINGKGIIVGTIGDSINTNVPLNSEVGRFEIGFPGWRDVEPLQIGAKIAGIRRNVYQDNKALVQSTDLAFFTGTGSTGTGNSDNTFHDTSIERVRITNDGKVGIGTSSPAYKLDVSGDIRATGNWYWSPSANFMLYPTANGQEWSFDLRNQGTYTGNYWQVWSDVIGSILVVRGDTGNVGIGTTNPNKKLTVVGGSICPAVGNSSDAGIYFPTDPGGGSGDEAFIRYYVESGETTKLLIGINNDSDDRLSLYQYGAERLTIYNGNVGIGTTSPGYTLTVNGTAYVTSGSWSGSDIRWKTNITPLKNSLNKVLSLQGVSYNWKVNEFPELKFSSAPQIGLIAQEVEKIIPEVITTNDSGYKGISYEKLVPLLIEAIKEQQKEIDDLKEQIKEITV